MTNWILKGGSNLFWNSCFPIFTWECRSIAMVVKLTNFHKTLRSFTFTYTNYPFGCGKKSLRWNYSLTSNQTTLKGDVNALLWLTKKKGRKKRAESSIRADRTLPWWTIDKFCQSNMKTNLSIFISLTFPDKSRTNEWPYGYRGNGHSFRFMVHFNHQSISLSASFSLLESYFAWRLCSVIRDGLLGWLHLILPEKIE